MKALFLLLAALLVLTAARQFLFSFRAQKPADYAATAPQMSLAEHLNGDILSEGIIYGPTGRVTSSFVAQMRGEWSGNRGTLSEDFKYSTGVIQNRKWTLEIGQNGHFTATADDIVGKAKGEISGSTAVMYYRIVLPPSAGGHVLDVTDWLYLVENGTIINRSELRKYGIKVAELVATMRRVTPLPD